MNICAIQDQEIRCNVFWGEGRLIEEDVTARLRWQPLQEVAGSLHINPEFFDHPIWQHYRPDEQQPILFKVNGDRYTQTIRVNEYDLKAYVRGWKNAPVFRLKTIQFNLNAKRRGKSWKKAEAWFMIPGSLTHSGEVANPFRTIHVPVFQKQLSIEEGLLRAELDDCRLNIYSASLAGMPVTFVKLSEVEALQGNPPGDYSITFKTQYEIITGILALLTRQNLKPVWQMTGHDGLVSNKWNELIYYDAGAPRRNNFPGGNLAVTEKQLQNGYAQLVNLPLNRFIEFQRDVNTFKYILATHDILPRFQKAADLLNRLIDWRGSDANRWPDKLEDATEAYSIKNKNRFINEEAIMEWEAEAKSWRRITAPLHSMKVLVAGRSPDRRWYYGKRIKERNQVVTQLLAELIAGKHLNATGLLTDAQD